MATSGSGILPQTSESVAKAIPKLVKVGESFHLMVDGAPFIIVGGELAAASMTSDIHMARLWEGLKRTSINTVFGAVPWAIIEPLEGEFNFSVLDNILHQARDNSIHLVIQWFGSLKGGHSDSLSDYAPTWVKRDAKRFPRIKVRDEVYDDEGDVVGHKLRTIESVSIFSDELAAAEKKALQSLMKHVKSVDETNRGVILLQIGSQVDILRDYRDNSMAANAAFEADVPRDLLLYYHALGSAMDLSGSYHWTQFATDIDRAEEMFTAYHLATYVNGLAEVAKREYCLPTFTNIALRFAQGAAYTYPRESNYLSIWKAFAPSLDFLAPRMLHADYRKACKLWSFNSTRSLLVLGHPQGQEDIQNLWIAVGTYGALGVAAMNIDHFDADDEVAVSHFKFLRLVAPIILSARAEGRSITGFSFPRLNYGGNSLNKSVLKVWGGFEITVERLQDGNFHGGGCGLMVDMGEGKILTMGYGFELKAKSISPKAVFTRVLEFLKKGVENKEAATLRTLRMFNAEETFGGRVARMPATESMIAEVQFYYLEK